MAVRPGQIRYLQKGKLLGAKSHAGFVDTFNWMLSWIYNFRTGPGLQLSGERAGKPRLSLGLNTDGGAPVEDGQDDMPPYFIPGLEDVAPFTVRFHQTEDDQTGQWEIYLPNGCCNVGGGCAPMNPKASEKSGHEDDADSWYALPGADDNLAQKNVTVGEGEDAREVTQRRFTVYAHVKPSAKVYGVDEINDPARRLLAVCIRDGVVEDNLAAGGHVNSLGQYRSYNTAGDIFSAEVASVAITEDGTGVSRSVRQFRTTPIDLVPPAGTGVSDFDLVWSLEFNPYSGQLHTMKLYCVRQTAAAAGIAITGDTMTEVQTSAGKVYARIDATHLDNGSGIVQVLKDPQGVETSSPYVVWLPLYDLDTNGVVTADYRSQSLVNLQLFHA